MRVVLAVVSLAASLLAAEAGLQLLTEPLFPGGPPFPKFPWLVYDPVFAWRNLPGYRSGEPGSDGFEINAIGFRGPEVRRPKPPASLRIVCLGDSSTFGVRNVSTTDAPRWTPIASYPQRLAERLLREGYGHAEVVNAGVVGYSSSHGLRQLALQVLPLEPDILTLRFGANDVSPSWAPARRAIEPETTIGRWLLARLHSGRIPRLAIAAWLRLDALHPEPNSVRWVSDASHRLNLERMLDLARERGVRVLLLDYPLAKSRPERPAWHAARLIAKREQLAALSRIQHEVARRFDTPILQTADPFAAHPEPFDVRDFVHPNAEGAALLADLLFERLRTLGWLDLPGR